MKKYLAIFNDEHYSVEINGFQVITEKEMDAYEELASSITWDFIFELGDDKELEFGSGDDLLSKIDFKEISNEEYKALNKIFENGTFGIFISEEHLQTIVTDSDESTDADSDEDDDEFNEDDY